jgi:hypothetical protein
VADLVGAVHGHLCHRGDLRGTASWTADVAKVGWFALLDSFAAGYLGAAIVLNVSMGKEHLPLFPTKLGKA